MMFRFFESHIYWQYSVSSGFKPSTETTSKMSLKHSDLSLYVALPSFSCSSANRKRLFIKGSSHFMNHVSLWQIHKHCVCVCVWWEFGFISSHMVHKVGGAFYKELSLSVCCRSTTAERWLSSSELQVRIFLLRLFRNMLMIQKHQQHYFITKF